MAIQTVDNVEAGFQTARPFSKQGGATQALGRPFSYWAVAGQPAAGAYSASLNGVTLVAPQVGQLPHFNPVSGNAYLGRLEAQSGQACSLMLCDRLWHNGGFTITSTGAQAIVSPAWPARDANGATAGDGVLIGLEVSVITGANTPTITLDYTSSANVPTRAAVNIDPTAAASTIGSFYRMSLQAGDTGVKSVESMTLSASWTSGTVNLVAYRVLATLELPAPGVPNMIDAITAAFPRLYDGVVPFFIMMNNNTSSLPFGGIYAETHG